MKKLILSLLFALTAGQANADVLAQINLGIGVGLSGLAGTKKMIATVHDDGALNVVVTSLRSVQDTDIVANTTISKRNLEKVKDMVIPLSRAIVIREQAEAICKIYVSPEMYTNHLMVARDYDYKLDMFMGSPETVHGPQGCWVLSKIYLAHSSHNNTAEKLKTLIEVLANEAIGEILQ